MNGKVNVDTLYVSLLMSLDNIYPHSLWFMSEREDLYDDKATHSGLTAKRRALIGPEIQCQSVEP